MQIEKSKNSYINKFDFVTIEKKDRNIYKYNKKEKVISKTIFVFFDLFFGIFFKRSCLCFELI